MDVNDAVLLTFGFNLLEQDGGGLDEGWEEVEDEDELEGFEVEDEDGVLVDEEDEEEYDDVWADASWDEWEVDDGPDSTSEADPE